MAYLDWTFYHNSLRAWLAAIGVAVLVYLALVVLRRAVLHQLRALSRRTRTNVDDAVADVLIHTRYFFLLFLAFYGGVRILALPPTAAAAVRLVGVVVLTLQVALWGNRLIAAFVTRRLQADAERDPATATTVGLVGFLARLALWSVVILVGLDNLGIDITALVAGLGVGGIAVALALQKILGDVFASLSIVLDRPFEAGDFIIVGDLMGTVERVGVKTTRVRSLSGEQLVFSNADLLGSRIRNFKRMFERRVLFTLGVVYQTTREQLEAIPDLVREIVEAQPSTRFDRCHFKGYGAFSLDIETVYYVLDPDYNRYMDIQQAINLEVFGRFAAAGIEFAYPTQTLLLQRAPA